MKSWVSGLLLLMTSCSTSAPLSNHVKGPEPSFCFDFEYQVKGDSTPYKGRGCFAKPSHCYHAHKKALRYGSMGGVSGVGECEY